MGTFVCMYWEELGAPKGGALAGVPCFRLAVFELLKPRGHVFNLRLSLIKNNFDVPKDGLWGGCGLN